jgi:hypothetical protein
MDDNIGSLIERTAAKYGEDPQLAKAIAFIESRGRNIAARPGHSAAGVFQIIPSTARGLGVADVNDPAQNVDGGIRLLRDNRAALTRSLGRQPTAGELYLAHQQGAAGASALLGNPDAPATSVVPRQNILANGGWDGMTSRQFASLWSNKIARNMGADLSGVLVAPGPATILPRTGNTGLGATPWSLAVPSLGVKSYEDLWTPPENSSADIRMAHRESTAGSFDLMRDAYSATSITGSIMRAGRLGSFDADAAPYQMTADDLKRRMEKLQPQYAEWFARAVSAEHADALELAALDHQKKLISLSDAGWKGTAATILANILDPSAIAVGVATGGLGNMATKAYQLGTASRIAVNAGIGAAANLAVDKAVNAAGDPEHHDPIMAALTGAAFGAAYGWLSGPRGSRIVRGARDDIADIERRVGGDKPAITDPPAPKPGDPTPDAPEIVRPTGDRTGAPEVDDAIERTRRVWDDDLERRVEERQKRIHERQTGGTMPDRGIRPTTPGETPAPAPKPTNDNFTRVATSVVNEDPRTRQIAQFVEEMAAKFGITKLIRVGAVDRYPDARLRPHNPYGVATPFNDGSFGLHIDVSGRIPLKAQIETVTHEFGHILDMHFFNLRGDTGGIVRANANVRKAYDAWRAKAGNQSHQAFLKEYFGPAMQETFGATRASETIDVKTAIGSQWEYRSSRPEWFAQEVAKWAASTEEPLKLVDKVWKKVADYWRKLYFIATGKRPEAVPSDEVRAWIKGIYNDNAIPDPAVIGKAASEALTSSAAYPVAAAEPLIYRGAPQLASGRGLSALDQGDVARTQLGRARFSIAAEVGRSNNPGVRALGAALVEDAPGKQGGAINGQSAELYATQRTKAAQTAVAQARTVAYDKWAEENGLNFFTRRADKAITEFEEQVSLAIRASGNTAVTDSLSPAVKQYASHLSKVMEDARKLAENPFLEEGIPDARPVAGFGATKEDARYLTRVFSAHKISEVVAKHSYPAMENLVRGAIQSAQPGLRTDILERLSKHFTLNVYKRSQGVIDEKVSRMFGVDDLELLKRDLMHDHGLTEADADEVIRGLRKPPDTGNDTRAKHRVVMDENYQDPATGLKLADILVNNATALTNAYLRHMYGKVSLARVRIVDPKTGDVLVNGITNEGDWTTALQTIREMAHDNRVPAQKSDSQIEALQAAYDQLTGKPHPLNDKEWAKAIRVAQKFNLVRLGHQFTFAQLGESYNMVGELGVKALMQQVPSFKRIVTADGRWIKANGLDQEIESIFGLGADRLRLMADVHGADDLRSLPMEAAGFWDRADRTMTKAGHAVLEMSGFHMVDGAMKQWTAKAVTQRFADMARKAKVLPTGELNTSHVNYKRMAVLGLDDGMLKRILGEVQANFSREKGVLFDGKVTRMNLDKWTDQEARIAFEGAVMRYSRRIVQENDIGSMHKWMSHPLWRMMMQFRAFPLHAWDKQLAHNAAMHDGTAAVTVALGFAIPTMIYAVQSNLQAIGRSDADLWLKERLSTKKLVSAALQRHGSSSMIPSMIDTTLPFIGQRGFFDSRNTQQTTDPLLGNPTVSLVTDASKATRGLLLPWIDGRRRSQQESRDIARMFGNNLITGAILNSMIADQPQQAPKAPR